MQIFQKEAVDAGFGHKRRLFWQKSRKLFHVKKQKGIKKRDDVWAFDANFIRIDGFSDNWRTSRNEQDITAYQTNQMLADSIRSDII